jgi:nonsense-mediated mRNA decay protein 3
MQTLHEDPIVNVQVSELAAILCDSYACSQANLDRWVTVVQHRQHVPHHRIVLYLEPLHNKHGQAALAIRVASAAIGGLNFFFGFRLNVVRLVDLLGTVAPSKPTEPSSSSRMTQSVLSITTELQAHLFYRDLQTLHEDLIVLSCKASRDVGGLV